MVGAEEVEEEADLWQPANKKHKHTPLSQLSREELEARVRQLDAHNTQLRNLLSKSQAGGTSETSSIHTKLQKLRQFDFSKHSRRHVALKLCYFGWDYQGFAVQEDSQNTIEAQLFKALLKTKLIESRETSNYHRCGRTDKGVSAFDQVISITLRSKLKKGVGVMMPGEKTQVSASVEVEKEEEEEENEMKEEVEEREEINYVQLLNRVLPQEIRVLAWSPVRQGFSARFDCTRRTYKYFFPRGGLDLQAMHEAGQHLVGEHDFRNLCKMDVGNGVVNFKRRILSVSVAKVEGKGDGGKKIEVAWMDRESSTEGSGDDCHIGCSGGDGKLTKGLLCGVSQSNERREGRGKSIGNEGSSESSGGVEKVNEGRNSSESASRISDRASEGSNGDNSSTSVDDGENREKDESKLEKSNFSSATDRNVDVEGIKGSNSSSGEICASIRDGDDNVDGYEMCVATIEGQAFLWHQVRAVMAVLFLVGEGKEQPSIVAKLLDVQKHPRKPQYSLACDLPLSLWSVEFGNVKWRWEEAEVCRIVAQMQRTWVMQAVRSTMIQSMLSELETCYKGLVKVRHETEEEKVKVEKEEKQREKKESILKKGNDGEEEEGEKKNLVSQKRRKKEGDEKCEGWEVREQATPLMTGTRTKVYRPLLSRPTCESLEQRVEHYVKRQRLNPGMLQKFT